MKRITFVSVFILSFLMLACGRCYSAVIDVPGDYPTIQAAIDAAVYGDEVHVATGTYSESIIMKDGVSLIGENTFNTFIQAPGAAVSGANDCILTGFTISALSYGIICTDISSFEIADNIIDPVPESGHGYSSAVGIYVYRCSDILIAGNTIGNVTDFAWGFAAGISLTDTSDTVVMKNKIYNIHEGAWAGAYGIYMYNGIEIKLYNNMIYHIVENAWDNAYGMYLHGSSNEASNNVIKYAAGNMWGAAFGIYNNASFTKISNNIVEELYADPWWGHTYGIYENNSGNDISYNNVWRVQTAYYGPISGPGNLNVDPMFVGNIDPSFPEYYALQPGSPCIDAGDPDPAYNDLDGTRNDMGIFGGPQEYSIVIPGEADILVYKYPIQSPRPGFNTAYDMLFFNRGGTEAKNVRLDDVFPAETSFSSSNPVYTELIDGLVRWNLGNVASRTGGKVRLDLYVPPDVELGTELLNVAVIKLAGKENNKENNISQCVTTVIGSWDPNDKGVTPSGFIKGDEELFYVVHYENEGTAEAINIRIEDTLTLLLDDTTINGISDGGTYDPSTRTITWFFENINLPPGETDYVYFTIKPVEDLAVGTQIKNSALITFDFNEPMETPETVTIIGSPEELELQSAIHSIIEKISDLEDEMIDAGISDLETFITMLNDAIRQASLALQAVYDSELPWLSLNACQAILAEVKDMIDSQSGIGIPTDLADKWIGDIEDDMIPVIQETYPPEPIAIAGPDRLYEATGVLTEVMLNGEASYDPNPDDYIETYTWYDDSSNVVATGVYPTVELELGSHTFTLVVNDGEYNSVVINNGTDEDSVVAVTVIDTTPPIIGVSMNPDTLWPPNHKMVDVHADVTVSDVCDPSPQVILVSVTSSEPDNGNGDGNTVGDIGGTDIGTEDYEFSLRAERQGGNTSRIYTVQYTATDASGNSATAYSMVTVPHNK